MDALNRERVLRLFRAHPEGVDSALLSSSLSDLRDDLAAVIQPLLDEHVIEPLKAADGSVAFRLLSDEARGRMEKCEGLGDEDRLVLQEIEKSHTAGIWTRDLARATGLQQAAMFKILRRLEHRRLVKSCHSFTNKNKKMYIAFDLELAEEAQGGPWVSDQEYDEDFIQRIKMLVFNIIKSEPLGATLETVHDALRATGVVNVELQPNHVRQMLDVLRWDGQIELVPAKIDGAAAAEERYRPTREIFDLNMFTTMPCGVCPVFDHCVPGGVVSPESCAYFPKWLEF